MAEQEKNTSPGVGRDQDGGPETRGLHRRNMLLGLGLAGGLMGLGAADRAKAAPAAVADGDRHPFFGRRQAGIVTPQPAAALVASFDVLAGSRAELETLLRGLTQRIAFLTQGGPLPAADPQFPPPDSGLLGPVVVPDNLTMTVAVGASLFDRRFGLAEAKPRHLIKMEEFPNDALDAARCHGDILVQFCSNAAETNIHALRDLIKHLANLMTPRWKIEGFLPPGTRKTAGEDTNRNLLGFKDGTANLDARDGALMDKVVWVQPGSGEPEWAQGGSYQVVRIIRNLTERWDRTPLGEQQTIIGRHKMSGAPLGLRNEHDPPDYAADPAGLRIPLDAHIRLANPRTKETEANLILRRGYNFSGGLTPAGQLEMGLLFICFQSDLSAGFLTVQARLNGEQLEEYIKPVGGGYFFALPGVASPDDFIGRGMMGSNA